MATMSLPHINGKIYFSAIFPFPLEHIKYVEHIDSFLFHRFGLHI